MNLTTNRPLTPYATVGGGVISIQGRLPRVSLTGNYQFSNISTGATYNETDAVIVTDTRHTSSFAGILGGGVKCHVSSRWGVRFDARVFLSANPARTTLDATPSVVLGRVPAGRITLNADPTIQFGNSANPVTGLRVTALAPSSLSGPAITALPTWSGGGVSTHWTIAVGMLWRF